MYIQLCLHFLQQGQATRNTYSLHTATHTRSSTELQTLSPSYTHSLLSNKHCLQAALIPYWATNIVFKLHSFLSEEQTLSPSYTHSLLSKKHSLQATLIPYWATKIVSKLHSFLIELQTSSSRYAHSSLSYCTNIVFKLYSFLTEQQTLS